MSSPNQPQDNLNLPLERGRHFSKAKMLIAALAVTYFVADIHENTNQSQVITDLTEQVSQLDEQLDKMSDSLKDNNLEAAKRNERLVNILGAAAGSGSEGILNNDLKSIDELKGTDLEVDRSDTEKLKAATVKLGVKNPEGDTWQKHCTGIKVKYEDKIYVSTARHCFDQDYKDEYLGKGGGGDVEDTGFNITRALKSKYSIFLANDANINYDANLQPIGAVRSITIDNSGDNDYALLSIFETEDFNAIPAYEIKPINESDLVQGANVSLYGLPAASGNFPVSAKGVYLGLTEEEAYSPSKIVVGIESVSDPSDDACNFGASGSSSVIATKNGSFLTGPLSARNSIKFGEGTPFANEGDDPKQTVSIRLHEEGITGVDMFSFDTICYFSYPRLKVLNNLVNGFTHELPPANFGGMTGTEK